MQKEFHANIPILECLQSVVVHPNSNSLHNPKPRGVHHLTNLVIVQMLHIAGIVQSPNGEKRVSNLSLSKPIKFSKQAIPNKNAPLQSNRVTLGGGDRCTPASAPPIPADKKSSKKGEQMN